MRRAGFIALGIFAAIVMGLLVVFGWAQTSSGKRQILALIESEVADPPARLHAEAITGLVPFDMQLAGVTLSDAKGIWLTADHLALAWSPTALLGKELSIRDLSSDRIVLSRLPESPPATKSPSPSGPLLPNLPIDIDLQKLNIDRLELGSTIIGEAAVFAIDAKAKLGDPRVGLQAALDFRRLDKDLDHAEINLDYRPATDALTVDLDAEEPQGGLLTKLLGLAGKPKLQARVHGEGPLADWHAKGSATVDEKPLFDLTADSRGTETRTINLQAKLQPGILLPENLVALTSGGVAVDGQVRIAGEDQPIAIDHLTVTAAAGSLSAKGTVDPGKSLVLDLAVETADSTPYQSLLPPGLSWAKTRGTMHLEGAFDAPKVTADIAVESLAFQGNQIGHADLNAAAILHTDTLAVDNLTASLDAKDIALADPRLQPLLDQGASINLAGGLDKTGAIKADQLSLHAGAITLNAQGSASQWGGTEANLDAKLDINDTAALLAMAGMKGSGAVHLSATLDKSGDALDAKLDTQSQGLSLGIAALDRLLGGAPKIQATVARDAAGTVTVTDLALGGQAVNLKASGTLGGDNALALQLDGTLKDLSAIVPKSSGALHVGANVTGTLDAPVATVKLNSDRLAANGISATALQATIDARGLRAAPQGKIDLSARLADLPAQLSLALRTDFSKNRFTLSGIKARLGKTSLAGDIDLTDMLANGKLRLDSPDLGELSPLAGQKLAGAQQADIGLRAARGKQAVELHAKGQKLQASGAAIESIAIDGTVSNALQDNPGIDLTAALRKVTAGGQQLDRIDAKAAGNLGNLSVTASAAGPDVAMATVAAIKHDAAQTAIALSKFDLTFRKQKANLVHPAQIALGADKIQVSGLALDVQGGSLALDADLSPAGNRVDLKLAKLPLSLAEAASADLHMLGTVSGSFQLDGAKSAPQAVLSLKGTGLGVAGASEQLADLAADATWRGGKLDAKGRLALSGKNGALDFTAGIPLEADARGLPVFAMSAPLRADAKGKLDLGLVNAFIPGGADHVAGQAEIALDVAGVLNQPQLSGKVDLADGRYDNQRYGIRLRNITAHVEGSGSALKIVSLTARTPDGGKLGGSGGVDFGSSVVDIALTMDHARMINAPIGTAVTSGALAIKGNLEKSVALTGKVRIDSAEIRIPDKLPANVEEIPVVEVNVSPEQAARLAALDKPPAKSMKIGLDIAVDAPQQVYVRGRGLDAELGGKLAIRGTADQPLILGNLDLRHGTFNLLGNTLSFDHGRIAFSGGAKIDPVLDFSATTKAEDTDITLSIGGSATAPAFTLHSTPDLPQDEILARLLFGKASGQLTPFEAVQLAQAVAELSGVGGGSTLDKFRKTLGLDRLDISSGDDTGAGPSVSAGRYVSRGVFVGATQGTKPGSSAATVEIELAPNVKAETQVGADSTGKAGVNMEWNY